MTNCLFNITITGVELYYHRDRQNGIIRLAGSTIERIGDDLGSTRPPPERAGKAGLIRLKSTTESGRYMTTPFVAPIEMNAIAPLSLVVVLVVATVALVPIGATADAVEETVDVIGSDGESVEHDGLASVEHDVENGENETDRPGASGMAPGERLGGVLGVQNAELNGAIETRALGHRIAAAPDNETQADTVAEAIENAEARLETIRERKDELREQRNASDISEGEYRSRTAQLAAELHHLERFVNASERHARGVPPGLLEDRGVHADRVDELRRNASEMRGGEVSEIARDVAGPQIGPPEDNPRPDHAGPDDDRGPPANESDRGPPDEDDDDRGAAAND